MELANCLEERVSVTLTLQLGSAVLRPKAEMLFPMWSPYGYVQPFRFTALRLEERHLLESEIGKLLKQPMGRHSLGFRQRSLLESF